MLEGVLTEMIVMASGFDVILPLVLIIGSIDGVVMLCATHLTIYR